MYVSSVVAHRRREEITEAYPTEALGPNTTGYCVDYYLSAILSWVDLHAERSLAKWRVNDFDQGFGGGRYISVQWIIGGYGLLDLID
jgi:hypothetical protein